MPELWATQDAVNRKLHELYARDPDAVNRKLRELWAKDSSAVNRKIFSGYDCRAENYWGSGINADGSIEMNTFGASDGSLFEAIHLHFNDLQSYTSGQVFATFYSLLAYQYDNFGGTGKSPIGISITDGVHELFGNTDLYVISQSTKSCNSKFTGSSADFYIWIRAGAADWPFCFTASGLMWCEKQIQHVEII